jgi:hypothetical protein
MSADPLLHRDNLDQQPAEDRESGALGSDQPEMLEIRLDPREASIYVRVIPILHYEKQLIEYLPTWKLYRSPVEKPFVRKVVIT